MSVAWVGAGVAAVGVLSNMDASRHAANVQADAAKAADKTQRDEYNQTRKDNLPWMKRGNAAGDRLNYMLGLSPKPGTKTREQLIAELTPQFTKSAGPSNVPSGPLGMYMGNVGGGVSPMNGTSTVDQAGLNAAVDAALKSQASKPIDPAYGSLMRNFSLADLAKDPVYSTGLQFGLNEGEKALNRQAAASGSLVSGATLKALTRYANDYGNTKAGEAYNRYNTNQNNQYNRLAGVAGTGQTANSLVASSGANAANNISANQIGAGNARASGYIGQANAITGGLSQGYNMYQDQQLLSALSRRTPTPTQTYGDWNGQSSSADTPTNYLY